MTNALAHNQQAATHRTAQIPARRPGITTGFSQARSCHMRR